MGTPLGAPRGFMGVHMGPHGAPAGPAGALEGAEAAQPSWGVQGKFLAGTTLGTGLVALTL